MSILSHRFRIADCGLRIEDRNSIRNPKSEIRNCCPSHAICDCPEGSGVGIGVQTSFLCDSPIWVGITQLGNWQNYADGIKYADKLDVECILAVALDAARSCVVGRKSMGGVWKVTHDEADETDEIPVDGGGGVVDGGRGGWGGDQAAEEAGGQTRGDGGGAAAGQPTASGSAPVFGHNNQFELSRCDQPGARAGAGAESGSPEGPRGRNQSDQVRTGRCAGDTR